MLRKCPNCNRTLQYLDNPNNNYAYLICPKCHHIFDDEKFVTVTQRIEQGYSEYVRADESMAYYYHELFYENDEED